MQARGARFRTSSARVALAGLALAGLPLACARDDGGGRDGGALDLVDFVSHQRLNLDTDLISVPDAVGLERFEYGWQIEARGDPEASWAEITGRVARLTVFSAGGDLGALELELALAADAPDTRRGVRVYVNGHLAGRIRLAGGEWSTHRLELPPDQVRMGDNLLALHPGRGTTASEGRSPSPVRLRQLRLVSRSGRSPWSGRPAHIRVERPAPGSAESQTVEMPTASSLDLVFRVPPRARLTAGLTLASPSGTTFDPVHVSVRLLDERQEEKPLFRHTFRNAPESPHRLAVNLEPWAEQLVRLRLGVGGPGNALVRWQDARVQGTGPITEPIPGPSIARAPVARSSRLGRPDVLVVLLDAARADAFSPFGGPHDTPAAERLASEGTAFGQALAAAPWTGQSVPALFTGLFPDTLGVGPWGSPLPEGIATLAELMAGAGYRTVLWSQHVVYALEPSFTRGFEEVYGSSPSDDFGVLPGVEDLLPDGRPTFAFVHLMPPHQPYTPPAPFIGSLSGWYQGDASTAGEDLNRLAGEGGPLSAAHLRYVRDRYLENVAFADDLLGRVLSLFDQRGRYRDALVVLLSDHGEAFYEHGRFLHSPDVHREVLHVPLIIKWPASVRGSQPVVSEPVSLIDIVPTLVDGLSLEGGPEGFQGRSFLPLCFQGRTSERVMYAATRGHHGPQYAPRPQLMLESGSWRILHRVLSDESALFRSDSDPLETKDLASEYPLRTLLLRQAARIQAAWNRDLLQRGRGPEQVRELNQEEREQLEALGYLN